ncbi:MAG: methyltransferase domain-containing protein [Nanoarchaeota archaeon]
MNLGRKLTNCRMCESNDLYIFLDLGFLPPADRILSKEHLDEPEIHFPLKVAQCQNCGLTQLTYVVNPEILYGETYSYESSITEAGKKHFFDMAEYLFNKFNLSTDDLVVDIGSNVGVLLEGFKKIGCRVLGIDYAPRIVEIANRRGIETWKALMNVEVAAMALRKKGRAKIITATNVFAHIDDKDELIKSVKILLDHNGILVIEAPYFVDLIDKLEYDTIYLDHLEYLSVKPLVNFFKKNGLEVFDVERYEIHGNSIRVFVGKRGLREISNKVKEFIDLEEKSGIYKKEVLNEFARKISGHKKELLNLIYEIKKQGKRIVGVSAPAKGNTLLNYCKIDSELIDYMTEKSKIKINHFTPGMHIPIFEEEKLLKDSVDYGIIFAWNFAEEIIKNPVNRDFIKKGGKFIKPIPRPVIMETDTDNELRKQTIDNINNNYIEIKKSVNNSDFSGLNKNSSNINNDYDKAKYNLMANKNSNSFISNTNIIKEDIEKKQDLFGVEIKKIDPVFIDDRGIISDLINEPVNNVGLITTEKNAVRGSHYHKKSNQYSYILSGKFEVLLAPYDQPVNVKKVILHAGELITIPSFVIHQFKALDRAVMINMESQSRSGTGYEDDTVRVKINIE